MIDSKTTAKTLSALAHPSRVDIFKSLLKHYPNGLKARAITDDTGIAPSTLSHHLAEMEKGGLIVRASQGQSTLSSLNLENLTRIASDLMQVCCVVDGIPQKDNPNDL